MKQFRTIDLGDIEKITRDYCLTNNYSWHDDPATRRITGLGILKLGLPELKGVSGVHATIVKPNLRRGSDYAFDFRDKDDNEILPFFTAEKPLFCGVVFSSLFREFPELERVHTAKMGLCNRDAFRDMCRPIEQKFDTCRVTYSGGFIERL